jgi:hypothetical protein
MDVEIQGLLFLRAKSTETLDYLRSPFPGRTRFTVYDLGYGLVLVVLVPIDSYPDYGAVEGSTEAPTFVRNNTMGTLKT